MASISMTLPLTQNFKQSPAAVATSSFINPLPLPNSRKCIPKKMSGPVAAKFEVKASAADLKEKVVTGLTAAALTASMVIPDAAEAAVSPSLKNFLLSIVAGGVVLGAIVGAVIGVANFDPVKRS